jgi:DNA invertase Pin-like site-specific DNA recombinase
VERYIQQGWSKDIIQVRVAGSGTRGVSASKLRIDQRTELQDTIADIKAGTCKLVGAYSHSRLFRDRWGSQVAVFMQICAENDCLVKIGERIYDFNDSNDRLIFKIEAEFAAKDNELRAKITKDARRRVSMRGEYDGRPIAVGFIVDRDKHSPTYNHFIPYEPHSKVVRWLYKRYRELCGRFNLLAAEVARMPVVFPSFEEWVSKLDVSKMQLKRVPEGYHISRWSLHKLLMCVEYAGYWKVDGCVLTGSDGLPLQTHEAIVDQETWNYAFTRLSEVTLSGEQNIARIDGKAGWVTAPKPDNDKPLPGLLHGILTSSQGTVRYSSGIYNVAEQRPGHSQRSNTLSVDALRIDTVFKARLAARLVEMQSMGKAEQLQQQLANMQQAHKQALVGVDEQIAGYEQKIANIQAYVATMGQALNQETLLEYGAMELDARANLTALRAKKNAAEVQESRMLELINRVKKIAGSDKELSQNFISLACESISLDEYSSHFVTLTIYWRAPFNQVDVCYIYRDDGNRMEWTEADEQELARLYPYADRKVILERFSTRSWLCIMSYAQLRGMERYTRLNTSGITNRSISLADHKLLQAHGWVVGSSATKSSEAINEHSYWLYDVTTTGDTAVTSAVESTLMASE